MAGRDVLDDDMPSTPPGKGTPSSDGDGKGVMAGDIRRDPGGDPELDAILERRFCACDGDEEVLDILGCLEAE